MHAIQVLETYNFWNGTLVDCGHLRPQYLEKIEAYLGNRLVKVILGQRRSGKSYLLRMVIRHLQEALDVPLKNILYINKDLHEFDFIRDEESLIEIIATYRQHMQPEGKVYLFLDEVQEINGWEKVVNSLSQNYKEAYEIFITGSNAHLLSQELGTYLSGRYVEFYVFPLSYTEYLAFKNVERKKETFLDYLKIGGIPELYTLHTLEMKKNYIQSLKDSIVLRDVIHRHAVRDVFLLEKLVDYITDSVGSLFSITSIVNTLKSKGYKSNYETIASYLKYLEGAFYIHECPRFDLRGKRLLVGERKYYLNDLGFKYFLTSSFDKGFNRFLENLVFLDLKRKGYTLYTGRLGEKEIDFIAEKGSERIYVQVAYVMPDQVVFEREFGNLAEISDHYPKYVVTLDDVSFGNKEGIQHQLAWEWLD